jgi:hypothetical protein
MPLLRFVALAVAKSFSKLFGLATITFFGRQPSRDDDKMAAVGVISLVWLSAVIAAVAPAVGEIFVPFVSDEDVVRWVGVATVVLAPPVVGFIVSRVHNREGETPSTLIHLGLGYAYAPVIALLVVALVLVVPVVKASHILRRFEVERIAVMIEDGRLDEVRDAVLEILERNGIEAEAHNANRALRWVFGGLVWTEGRIFRRDVTRAMVVLRGEVDDHGWFEITLNATDIAIIGQQAIATRIMALLAEELDVRTVYFTWDDAAQAVEDEIRACREELDGGQPCDRGRMDELNERVRSVELSREEWDALHRQLYLVQRDSERLRADLAADGQATAPDEAHSPADPLDEVRSGAAAPAEAHSRSAPPA